jgi:uncharacterized cupredoxin-like copper-binding protein
VAPNRRQSRLARLVGVSALLAGTAALITGTPAAGAADSNKLTVTAGEYTYKLSGKPQPGNIELTFKNTGIEYHMLGLVALKPGVTVKQLSKALMSDDDSAGDKLVKGSGEVSPLPGFLGPNRSTTTIVNLKAGHYGMFCYIPAPDGRPHLAHGMVGLFDVAGSKSSYQPPTDGVAKVTLTDTAITLPPNGLPKRAWVKVTNSSKVARSLVLAEYLTPDATFESADAYFNEFFENGTLPAGDPPASINGGVSLSAGKVAYFQVELDSSGKYTLVSSNDSEEDDPNEMHADFTAR